MTTLLVATHNKGKLREIKALLEDIDIVVMALSDLDDPVPEVIEDGATFKENALKKAVETANHTQFLTLADDSGLCVDALNGDPGVYSARFADGQRDDAENRKKVLMLLNDVPEPERTARFKCSIALAVPHKMIAAVEGVCEGKILREEKGVNGFGYDPIFYFERFDRTFAEISAQEKNEVSHRANALRMMKDILVEYLKNAENA